jgi:hypothetical protein
MEEIFKPGIRSIFQLRSDVKGYRALLHDGEKIISFKLKESNDTQYFCSEKLNDTLPNEKEIYTYLRTMFKKREKEIEKYTKKDIYQE